MFKLIVIAAFITVASAFPAPGVVAPVIAVHTPVVHAAPVAISHSSSHILHHTPVVKTVAVHHTPIVTRVVAPAPVLVKHVHPAPVVAVHHAPLIAVHH